MSLLSHTCTPFNKKELTLSEVSYLLISRIFSSLAFSNGVFPSSNPRSTFILYIISLI
nr:MAG TPA: hypothetical protein [Bacteriophage sp.]